MFDIGWQELFLIGLITVLVVGPKELPRVLRMVIAGVRKMRGMANDFQRGLDELARETEIDEIRKDLEQSATVDLERELEETIDPTGEMTKSMRALDDELSGTGPEDGGMDKADTVESDTTGKASAEGTEIPPRLTSA